jgi:hypothetical protein
MFYEQPGSVRNSHRVRYRTYDGNYAYLYKPAASRGSRGFYPGGISVRYNVKERQLVCSGSSESTSNTGGMYPPASITIQ